MLNVGISSLKLSIYIYIFCFLIIAFGSETTLAQNNSTLRVRVTSAEDATPIPSANVLLLNAISNEQLDGEATNSYGVVNFNNLSAGKYILKVIYLGYTPYVEEVKLKASDVKVVAVTLKPSTQKLRNLVVEENMDITIGNVAVRTITPIDIKRVPAPVIGGDLATYLQTIPGIVTPGDRGGQLFIRGGAPWQNKVLVDGLPIVKPFHILNLFSAFPTNMVQSVQFYAGGFGAKFYDATSAVIDVHLRPGNYKEYTGSATYSPYLGALHLEGPIEPGKVSFILSARKSLYNQFAPYVVSQHVPVNFYDVTGRVTVQGNGFTCNITGVRMYDSGQINPIRNIELSWQNTVIGGQCLGYSDFFDQTIEANIGYSFYKNATGPPDGANQRASSVRQLFLGFDNAEDLFGLIIDYGFDVSLRTYKATLAEPFTDIESFREKVATLSAYASTEWSPGDYISILPGVRALATFDVLTLQPRLRIEFHPDGTDQHSISIAAGKYRQIASGISDVRNAGTFFILLDPATEKIPPPIALHASLGYQLELNNNFKITAEGYVRQYNNVRVPKWTPIAKLETETTLATGLAHGFNLFFEYTGEQFYASIGYGYSNVKYKADTGNLGAWIEGPVFKYHPAHDQRHKLNAVLSFEISGFTINTRWEYGSGRPYTRVYGFDLALDLPYEYPTENSGTARTLYSRPYGGRLPMYHRLDVSVKRSLQISPVFGLDLQAGVTNVYNRSNIFYFDSNTLTRVNQTPFFPYISVRAHFE